MRRLVNKFHGVYMKLVYSWKWPTSWASSSSPDPVSPVRPPCPVGDSPTGVGQVRCGRKLRMLHRGKRLPWSRDARQGQGEPRAHTLCSSEPPHLGPQGHQGWTEGTAWALVWRRAELSPGKDGLRGLGGGAARAHLQLQSQQIKGSGSVADTGRAPRAQEA